jgi:integrase
VANKPKKRIQANGTVSWRVRWRYGGGNGPWQSVTLDNETDAKTLKAAVEVRGHMVRRDDPDVLDRSLITGHQRRSEAFSGPTFGEVREDYIRTNATAKPATRLAYRANAVRLAAWDDRPVAAITETDAHDLWNALRAGGDGRAAMTLAKMVMSYARSRHYISANPCDVVHMPKAEKVARYLTEAEYRHLLTHATTVAWDAGQRTRVPHEAFRLMIETAWNTGLRSGELCALQPGDIRIVGDVAKLWITRTATYGEEGWTVGPPKSKYGKRNVALPMDLALRLKAQSGKRWVFPGLRGMHQPNVLSARWHSLMVRAQEDGFVGDARFHDLRHSHASNLIHKGIPLFTVSRRLGHGSITITADTYGHLSPDGDAAVLAALA